MTGTALELQLWIAEAQAEPFSATSRRNAGESFPKVALPWFPTNSMAVGYLAGDLEAGGTAIFCYVSNVKCQMSNVTYQCTHQIPWLLVTLQAIWRPAAQPCCVMSNVKNVKKCQMLHINVHIISHACWLPLRLFGGRWHNHVVLHIKCKKCKKSVNVKC